jgi:phage/plasmid-like protein (TIGR03299 family)
MAHNIFYNPITKKNSFFSRKELAWHGLGQILDQDIVTAKEAMVASQSDFEVIKDIGYVEVAPGQFKASNSHYFTYRTDTNDILGVVGNDYEVVQNAQAFDFIDNIIMGGDASFETAGVIGNGAKIFITAKLPTHVKLGGEDIIEKYIFITTTHDGSGKIIAAITPIRIVCNNTLNFALSHCAQKVTFKHTKNVHNKLDMAHKLMGLTNKYYDEFQTLMESLRQTPVRKGNVLNVTTKLFLTPEEYASSKSMNFQYRSSRLVSTRKANIIDSIIHSIDEGVGQEFHRGTGLWLMNGITTYFQNSRDYRSTTNKLETLVDNKYSDLLTKGAQLILSNN